MIADADVAKKITETLLDVSGRIDASVALVQSRCSEAELEAYRRAAGEVLAEIWDVLLKPIFAAHPQLAPRELREDDA